MPDSQAAPAPSTPELSAGPREWLGLAVLALPTLLLAMDVTVLYLAAPHLTAELRPTGIEQLWIADIYGFMIAGFLITMGTVGDRIGRRKLLMFGATAFGAASVLAAFATSPLLLIIARALLGIAGATLMPSTLALISNMFRDARQRATAIGVWATCMSAGMAAGPMIGGLMLESFWWGSVFLLAVPVMALLLTTAPVLLPEYRDAGAGRIDIASVLLSLASILPLIFGIKKAAETGVSVVPVTAIAIGVGFGSMFIRRQRTLADPLLELGLFGNPTFRAALLILLLGLGTVGGSYLFITQYLQLVRGLTPLAAGLWLVPPAGALILSSTLTPIIARKVESRFILAAALALATLGYLTLSLVDAVGGLPLLVMGFVLVYAGISPLMVLGTDLVIGTTPPEKAGAAAAMSETSMEFGVATGIAVLGVLGTAIYRAEVFGAPAMPGAALDSLGAADAAVADLPAHVGDAVRNAAREAFTNGLNIVALVCAAVTAALAVVALTALRSSATADTTSAMGEQSGGR
ncbi:MFS transporter [Nocardia goodfellowii]